MSEVISGQSYARRFVESLEGLRAVAAAGVVVTHVAFQTGVDPKSHFGALTARFDFFVAVFYALSAFLLWRRHRTDRRFGRYYRRRIARIAPAYLVCAVVVLLWLPEAFGASPLQVLAQLTLTQIYVPDGLIGGLTHMWSLCVEVAFYLVLPLIALTIGRPRSRRARVAGVLALTVALSAWPWLTFVANADGAVNLQIWPPSYAPWFAVGLLAAEAEGHLAGRPAARARVARLSAPRWLYWAAAMAVAWAAGREWFGPLGLEHPSPGQFSARIAAGAVFAALIVVPYALAPRRSDLIATAPLRLAGRWSYSLFLWHVAVLGAVFPLTGIGTFTGGFWPVLAVTLVVSLGVAGVSHTLIEQPVLDRQRRREHRHKDRPGQQRRVTGVEPVHAGRPGCTLEPRRARPQ